MYKKSLRTLLDWSSDRLEFRYQAVLMRQRFEENRNVKDNVELTKILADSEKELFDKQHYQPIKFPYSPGGVAFGRTLKSPDWVLDYWPEEERAQYPEYFARREQRKKEYVDYWQNKFGVEAKESHH